VPSSKPKTPPKTGPKTGAKRQKGKKPGRRLWQWGLLVVLWGAIGLGALLIYYAYTLPDIDSALAEKQPPMTTLLAADGTRFASIGGGHGEWLDRHDVPDVLVDAVLAIEDRRFFEHGGMDYWAVLRAIIANVMAGDVVQGGSTLTQQLAKNLFLTPERTLKRKLQEAMLAFWLERNLSKDDILVHYMNRVYLGSGTYGVEAASQKYFDHSARQLSLSEAALVAGLLKAPSRYSPLSNRSASFGRMQVVLGAMVDAGVLDAEARIAAPNPAISSRSRNGSERYYIDWVMANLPGFVDHTSGDLIVHTTFVPAAQAKAHAALEDALDQWGTPRKVSQGAVLVMSSAGAVKAMVGGRSYAKSEYNRAVTALRQPGSAFKLFVYLTAFEAGMTPATKMRDTPFILENWQPRNYDSTHKGAMTLQQAFASSNNVIAVKLAERSNRAEVIKTAQRLGINTNIVRQPSLALGTSEVRLLELTSAYGVMANGGYQVLPYAIEKVTTGDGAVVYRRNATRIRIVAPEPVGQMQRIMAAAVETGTGKAARIPGRDVAGKTGTSQESRDAWFVGYSGDVVAGVWLGNDDSSPMNRVTGGFIPARIWQSVVSGLPAE
jgi:penicillin-binding protein 1A